MNSSTDSVRNFSISCRARFKEYFLENTVISLLSTALNLGSCPVIILMNVLVIVAIKTRRRLQSTYNILLACLAGTDLAVGVVSQPLFIAQEIYFRCAWELFCFDLIHVTARNKINFCVTENNNQKGRNNSYISKKC